MSITRSDEKKIIGYYNIKVPMVNEHGQPQLVRTLSSQKWANQADDETLKTFEEVIAADPNKAVRMTSDCGRIVFYLTYSEIKNRSSSKYDPSINPFA
jgi:hypothetical protein